MAQSYIGLTRITAMTDLPSLAHAALTLLPEGAFWSLMTKGRISGGYEAAVVTTENGALDYRKATTPAAALRAMIAQGERP
jgi:hypothetical protein